MTSDAPENARQDGAPYAVIMAGGSGTRFWPLSLQTRPKQFLAILGERSLLQETWSRALHVVGDVDRVLVVTAVSYAELTRQQLPDLPPGNLLLEPQARNTAPCLAWAAAVLAKRDPESVMVVFPADHVIRDIRGLTPAVEAAVAAAHGGSLVTFGIPPRYPETGYGYIEVGDLLAVETRGAPVHEVVAFREKPDLDTARRYVRAGTFLWNSGMFVWKVKQLEEALQAHLPEALDAAERMVATADNSREQSRVYGSMPATSIDYGIMERADNVACVRAPFDWSDVGTWAALHELLEGDSDGNVGWGRMIAVDARDNVVYAPEEMVGLLGVDGLAVVRAGDVLLVASLERSQDIKLLRDKLRELGLEGLL